MEEQKEQQQSIIDQLKEYADTRIKLAKYQAVDTGTSVISNIVTGLILVIVLLVLLVFVSFTLAFFLADVLASVWQGFGCVALIYLIVALILNAQKENIGKNIANKLIDKILN